MKTILKIIELVVTVIVVSFLLFFAVGILFSPPAVRARGSASGLIKGQIVGLYEADVRWKEKKSLWTAEIQTSSDRSVRKVLLVDPKATLLAELRSAINQESELAFWADHTNRNLFFNRAGFTVTQDVVSVVR